MRASSRDGWGARALRWGALGFLVACSGAEPGTGETPTAVAVSTSAVVTDEVSTVSVPDSVPDLVAAVPKSATTVVSMPSLDVLKKTFDASVIKLLEDALVESAPRIGLSPDLARKMLAGFGGAVLFIDGNPLERNPSACLIVRLADDSLVAPLVESAKLKKNGPDRWSNDSTHVAWLAKAKVALVASRADTLEAALAVASGKGESFSASPMFRKRPAQAIWISSDVGVMGKSLKSDVMGPGSAMLAAIDLDAGSLEVEAIYNSAEMPRYSQVLAPTSLPTLSKLPAGAIGALGIALKRPSQRTLTDLVRESMRSQPRDVIPDIEELVKRELKLSLADLERATGDEMVAGFYYDGGPVTDLEEALKKSGAFVANISIRDEKVARAVIDYVARETKTKATAGKLHKEKNGLALDVSTTPTAVVISFGATAAVAKVRGAKQTLADQPAFATARKSAPAEAAAMAYIDMAALMKLLPADMRGELTTKAATPAMAALQLKASDKGIHLVASAAGGAAVAATIGTSAAVATYGVRRYLQSAKTSEAKNSIGAIARGAVGAFEREGPNPNPNLAHALCKSAQAVPAKVPSATKYQPNGNPGTDYQSGSPLSGWRCLKFSMTNPHHYQYDYRAGGNYKGPKRGLPDPGPNGFEASAEGDLDGDGKTSLFTLTGKVENGTVKLSKEINIADELE